MEAKRTPKTTYLYPTQLRGDQNQGQLAASAQQAIMRPIANRSARLLTRDYLPAPAPVKVRYIAPQSHARLTLHQQPHREQAGLITQSAYLLPPANAPILNGLN